MTKENKGKKFDICLMNPPYDRSLHLKFLEKTIEIAEKVVSVQPNIFLKQFLYRQTSKFKDILKGKLEDIEIFDHKTSNKYFNLGHSINEIAIYVINNNTNKPIDIDKLGFETSIEHSVFDKILRKRDGKLGWENKNTKRHGKQTGFFVNLYTWHVGTNAYNTCINETSKFSRTVYFDNAEQVKNFKNSFNTKFMEFYVREIVWAGNGITDKCFMFDKETYNRPINDKYFFDFFDLSKEEQQYILNKVKSYLIQFYLNAPIE